MTTFSRKHPFLLVGITTLAACFAAAVLYPTFGVLIGVLIVIPVLLTAYLFETRLRQLGQQLQHYTDERGAIQQEMHQRNAELVALQQASLQLSQSLELKPILETIVETTTKLVEAEDVQVFLFDGSELTFGAAFYGGQQQSKPYFQPRPGGATYTSVRTGQAMFIPDVDVHPLYQSWKWGGAVALLPLSSGNQINGIMNVAYSKPHDFDESETRILHLLAGQAAIAIHNARLYEAVRQQATDRTVELVEVKDQAETVLNNSFDAIILLNPEYGIEQTNAAFRTLFGYTPEQLVQLAIFELVHPNYVERLVAVLHEVIATEQPVRIEVTFQRQDGTSFPADVALAAIPGQDNNQPTIACSIRDMTSRQRAEERQQKMTSGLRTVLAVADELMSAPDLDSIFREAVEAARNKLGVERCAIFLMRDGYLRGTYGTDNQRNTTDEHDILFPIFETWAQRIERVKPDDAQWIVVEENQTNWNGAENDVIGQGWIAITPIQTTDHLNGLLFNDTAISHTPIDETQQEIISVYCSLLGRIIERKQVEESILRALENEVELGELKSRFISNISHEFRTPLAIVQSSTQLLKYYQDRMDEAKKSQHLDKIETQVQQMTILLENVLTISRAEKVGLPFSPAPMDLIAFCQSIVEEILLTMGANHEIIFTSEGDLSDCAMDEKLLRQIITNLLTNAVKYSPAKSRVQFSLTHIGAQVVIQVKDEGIGIPADDQRHLFQDFHRARNVGAISGTGLGLSIVRRAAQAHGGNVFVESVVDKGTIFTVTLSPHRTPSVEAPVTPAQ